MPAKKSVESAKKKNLETNEERIETTEDQSASTDIATTSNSSVNTRKSRSERADVVFPVGRIHKELKKGRFASRIGAGAPVYLAGVLEYLVTELTELAGQAAKDNNKKRITPRHLMLAIKNDDEIDKLLSGVTISSSGVLPHIHPTLLPKLSSRKKKSDVPDDHLAEKAKGVKKKNKSDAMEIEENEQ